MPRECITTTGMMRRVPFTLSCGAAGLEDVSAKNWQALYELCDARLREAQNAVKVLENEAMQRAGEAGQAADAALRSDAERTCTAIRQQAEQRMDTAVRAIVEKVVKR